MKNRFGAAVLLSAALFFCSCASRHFEPIYHAGDENPPDFLFGPVAVIMTNLNGFSAHVSSLVTSPDGPPQTTSGELLGREGRLIYQPSLASKDKRARKEGGLFFIWDERKHSGYVLSEALQGYAPTTSDVAAVRVPAVTNEGVQAVVNGHPCHRCQTAVVLNIGVRVHLIIWEADDARNFPARIEAGEGTNHLTLDFTEIRLENPPQELFLPPDGFIAYASSATLMNELIVRDASRGRKRQYGDNDDSSSLHPNNWHDMPGAGTMGGR